MRERYREEKEGRKEGRTEGRKMKINHDGNMEPDHISSNCHRSLSSSEVLVRLHVDTLTQIQSIESKKR
jgi:hypothetical protein